MSQPFYGFLSNRYTSALISPLAVVEWLPLPRFDSDAIFCRLLDEEQGGYLSTLPQKSLQSSRQYYRPGTLILETILETGEGTARICDFLPIGHSGYWRRIDTTIPLDLVCRPTFGFGYARAAYEMLNDGAIYYHPGGAEGLSLHIRGPLKKSSHRDTWEIGPGRVDIVLRYAESLREDIALLQRPLENGERVEQVTERYWRNASLSYDGWGSDWVKQSLLVLRGLTYRTSGAMIAAATTSLPEVIGAERQWDYRYVWIRDGAYAAEALLLAGDAEACRQYLEFALNVADLVEKPFPHPFVRVDGTMGMSERSLGWMAGFQGSRPVRVGNAASQQMQLDLEGDVLWVIFRYWRMTGDRRFVQDYWWAIEPMVQWVSRYATQQKDASLWEFRDAEQSYTHSQVLVWVAVKCGAELAREVMGDERLARIWDEVQTVQRSVLRNTFMSTPEKRFGQSRENLQTDAALLTLPLYGFVSVYDETFQNTLDAIERDLVRHEAVWRYPSDSMGPAQYPFPMVGFWLARIYLRMGKLDRADQIILQQLSFSTDLKLFSEHVNPLTGQPRGNFPQLFTHAACVTTLLERERCIKGEGLPCAF